MDGLTRFEVMGLVAKGESKISLHHENEFLSIMFVGDRLMGLFGFYGNHEGAKVVTLCAGAQSLIGIILSPFDELSGALVANHRFFFFTEECAGIDLKGIREPQ